MVNENSLISPEPPPRFVVPYALVIRGLRQWSPGCLIPLLRFPVHLRRHLLSGTPQMPNSGQITGLLDIHSEVQKIDQNLNMALRLHISSHDSERKEWLIVFGDHGRNNGVEGTFSEIQTIQVIFVE